MVSENCLCLKCCSSIFLLISLLQTSEATNSHICSPSACGIISNISFPFRLKHDPKHCGYLDYELSCENNVTLLYLNSQKYEVKAINYLNFTMRVVDASINNNTCSFPNFSAYSYNFTDGYPYSIGWSKGYRRYYQDFPELAWPINFMSCPHPLNNSSLFIQTNVCANRDNVLNSSVSSISKHTYMRVGHMNATDVGDMCRVEMIVMTSWKFQDLKNVSISEIHESLLYGFELSWLRYPCSKCKRKSSCSLYEDHTVSCPPQLTPDSYSVVISMIIVVVFVGVSIPAKIILGFAWFFGLSYIFPFDWSLDLYTFAMDLGFVGACIVYSLAARLIIGFICLMGFLIYKFRRRHMSMFDAIESFLQSDNKLMPIRYSYSDIQKMTKSFQEELGQGGYGTVYKGKLRSGYDVAVKLLGKSGGNDQSFMNEIATIGRIHHVNVVKLVGYCAERSKRALVYDFMHNGSLDKFIYNQDKVKILGWLKKYEIALGVARGIEYLHRGCDIQILHFDIKPHNILLDDKFIPKISDFGLAKFYSTEKKTVTLTAARGTIGYVAPELINRGFGRVSYKADVYSFGMLLIEMVCLKKDLRGNDEKSSQYFPDWIYDCFDEGRDIEIGKTVEINEEDDNVDTRRIARKMTIVALWCIQMNPDDRPSMNKVLEMLEGEVERLEIPQRPTQPTQVVLDDDQSWTTSSTDSISLLRHEAASSCFEITVQDA